MIFNYLHEIGCRIDTRVQYWSFLWQMNATSGRTKKELATDLVDELDGIFTWYGWFRDMWANTAKTVRFRLREITPPETEWFDFYWRFSNYNGRDPQYYGAIQLRVPIFWFSDTVYARTARTEIGMWRGSGIEKQQATGIELAALETWVANHTAIKTTVHGDTFQPAIRNSAGQIGLITSHRLDGRVSTRKIKGRYR